MPNNDLISRASVLEALKENIDRLTDESKGPLTPVGCGRLDSYRDINDFVESAPAVTDSLSEELESLPREKCECRLELSHVNENENKWFAGYCYNGYTVHEGAWGVTPLAAVLALKEALNSTG